MDSHFTTLDWIVLTGGFAAPLGILPFLSRGGKSFFGHRLPSASPATPPSPL